MSDRCRRCLVIVCGVVMAADGGTAMAHGAFGSAAPFWSGALHVAVSPLAVVAIVGFGAAAARGLDDSVLNALGLGGMIAALTAWLVPAAWSPVAPLGVLTLGLIAALGQELKERFSLILGACAGLGVGASVDLDARNWAAALGVGAATVVATTWAVEILTRLRSRLPLAGRVVGAWVAAIALLLAALALRNAASAVR